MSAAAGNNGREGLLVGIDLDNTIILYDQVFHRAALERGLIPPDLVPRKTAVKAYIVNTPGGELRWRQLQSEVYAERVQNAEPASGVMEFLRRLHSQGGRALVISHKTVSPMYGNSTRDLRQEALDWLRGHGFLNPEATGLDAERVHFTGSREEKIRHIAAEGCDCFVDDLEDVLLDRGFPAGTIRIHFAPAASGQAAPGVVRHASWQAISEYLLP